MAEHALKSNQDACNAQADQDARMYDLGYQEGMIKAKADLMNPISNILHEIVNMVGIGDTLLYLSRVVGTFMADENETDEERFTALVHISDQIFTLRKDRQIKVIDGTRDDTKRVMPCGVRNCTDRRTA